MKKPRHSTRPLVWFLWLLQTIVLYFCISVSNLHLIHAGVLCLRSESSFSPVRLLHLSRSFIQQRRASIGGLGSTGVFCWVRNPWNLQWRISAQALFCVSVKLWQWMSLVQLTTHLCQWGTFLLQLHSQICWTMSHWLGYGVLDTGMSPTVQLVKATTLRYGDWGHWETVQNLDTDMRTHLSTWETCKFGLIFWRIFQ